ncbi:hypothetical protein A2890_02445 [candidate division WWE3 bacterium RIFCSPLOWO2_01_FULL_53_14]|uniref:Acyltransferase 3 domain-containing protein n=1 Tax=candidate division WWE3 bacterium RIFCSPLOWO2_01_FULL_53_14 TaxID=1802628 RepID=A0A1F4W061_UNCKA|nr:MAG: hypothetical protein A2890_02445 [candidate division WWE3 bacterium RIFCSPLOWO2_01_FULL_53_14]
MPSLNLGSDKQSDSRPVRDLSIDFLKGTAVIFMIVTHVNAFFYGGRLPLINFWTWWGATICFVTFVFAYGLGYGIRLTRGPLDRRDTLKRLAVLLGGYLVVASWIYWIWFGNPPTWSGFFKIFLFQEIPAFTEFMLAFFFYGILLLTFEKWVAAALRRIWVLPAIGLISYIASTILYSIPVSNYYLVNIKSLFVGNLDWNRWGIISYFIIFSLGLTFGYRLLESNRKRAWQLGLFAISSITVFLLSQTGFYSERWPPSVLYLAWGLAYSLGALVAWDTVLAKVRLLLTPIVRIGHFALDYFIFHTLLVVTLADLIGYRRLESGPTVAIFFGVILANYLISRLIRKSPSPS